MTIGRLARRTGVSVDTLRFYEREGLLRATRTSGGQRRYERSVLRRLAFIRAARTIGVGRVESPRGETSCIVETDGGRIVRLRLRTGSYANWPSVAHATVGNLLPDFPLINKSFELCYACADR